MPNLMLPLITASGAVLRVFNLDFKSLWVDEALIFQFANGDIEHVLSQNALYNSYPPLFAILTSAVMNIGSSEWVLRIIPCLAGIAAIPMMYYLAKNFMPHIFAVFAALLVALSPSQIMYSQQVVVYSLTFLLAEIILFLFLRFLGRLAWQNSVFLGLAISVSVFMQYGLAILILSINILFLVRVARLEQPIKAVRLWALAQVMGLIAAYAVYHLSFKYQFIPGGFGADYLSPGYWDGTFRNLLQIAIFNTKDIFAFAYPMTFVIIIFVILGVIWIARGQDPMKKIWINDVIGAFRGHVRICNGQTLSLCRRPADNLPFPDGLRICGNRRFIPAWPEICSRHWNHLHRRADGSGRTKIHGAA
jgi:4-amino-4-deoxy-L-arabinose transferase-like glycosyltransferase